VKSTNHAAPHYAAFFKANKVSKMQKTHLEKVNSKLWHTFSLFFEKALALHIHGKVSSPVFNNFFLGTKVKKRLERISYE
jgi:hypothetical protein